MLDAHVHLSETDKADFRLYGNDTNRYFLNATSPRDWDRVGECSDQCAGVVPFFGVHPWFMDDAQGEWQERLSALLDRYPAGIGEIGLDRLRKKSDFEKQKNIFRWQWELATIKQRPVVIHCVRAWDVLLAYMRKTDMAKMTCMVHGFAGSYEILQELLSLGVYCSFGLRDVQKLSATTKKCVARIPLQRLLIETDYPYVPGNAQAYEMCRDAVYVAVAALRGIETETLIHEVWQNGEVFTNRDSCR